jgi:hypothetical protein
MQFKVICRKEDRKAAPEEGFDHYLVKPVDIKKIGPIFVEAERRHKSEVLSLKVFFGSIIDIYRKIFFRKFG